MLSAYMIALKNGQHKGGGRGYRGLEGISIPADQQRVESLGLGSVYGANMHFGIFCLCSKLGCVKSIQGTRP